MSVLAAAARLRPRRPLLPPLLMLPDVSPAIFVLAEVSPAVLTFGVASDVLALPAISPFMFIVSPDVLALAARRALRLRGRRLRVPPPVLVFCVVIMPPRVGSSLCVVEELAFCAETNRLAVTRANDVMSTNKTVVLRVMLLLLTDVSPFSLVMLRTYK
jgi:hypothetical protein